MNEYETVELQLHITLALDWYGKKNTIINMCIKKPKTWGFVLFSYISLTVPLLNCV